MAEDNRGAEDRGWTTVRSKRWKKSDKERQPRRVFSWIGCTTFFVSNLPDGTTAEVLREKYGGFGEMADAFVSRRKDKGGSYFGFIRFRRVGDLNKMMSELNLVTLNGAKPLVALPRFDRKGKEIVYDKERESSFKVPAPYSLSTRNFKPVTSGISYRDMVGGEKADKPMVAINMDSSKEDCLANKLGKLSLIGYAKDLLQLNALHVNLKSLYGIKWELKYLGGLTVLISFFSKEDATAVLENSTLWKSWFFSLQWWEEQQLQFERVVWVKIVGIPPQLWSANTCNLVASRFGELLSQSTVRDDDVNAAFEWVAILSKNGLTINERCVITWKGRSYDVWIQEVRQDWVPDWCSPRFKSSKIANSELNDTVVRETGEGCGFPDDAGRDGDRREPTIHGDVRNGEQLNGDTHVLAGKDITGNFEFSGNSNNKNKKPYVGRLRKFSKGAHRKGSKPDPSFLVTCGGYDLRPRKRPRTDDLDLNLSPDTEDEMGVQDCNSEVDRDNSGFPEVNSGGELGHGGSVDRDHESIEEVPDSPRVECISGFMKEVESTCAIARALGINLSDKLDLLGQVIREDGVFDDSQ